jgi:hypothetical protein
VAPPVAVTSSAARSIERDAKAAPRPNRHRGTTTDKLATEAASEIEEASRNILIWNSDFMHRLSKSQPRLPLDRPGRCCSGPRSAAGSFDMRRIYLLGGLAASLLAAVAAWYFVSPGLTLNSMVAAAKANDADKLSAYIDYEALRRDMKADLTARLEAEARKAGGRRAELGLAMGRALMGPMVDAMVSPQGMKAAFAAMKVGEAAPGERGAGEPPEPVIDREGLGRFLVRNPVKPDSALVFERRGLGWKLVGIELGEPPIEAKR